MLLRGVAVGDRRAADAKRIKSLQQLPANSSSTNSRSLMWLCCVAQPLADDDPEPFTPSMGLQVVSRIPQGFAHAADSQPALSPKDPSAAAAAAVQGLTQQQQHQQQQQEQQVVVINADTSPRPGPPSISPLAASAAAATAADTSSSNDWRPQQQHLLLACQSRLSVDVHTLASGISSTAADAVANAACSLDRVSSSLVLLTQDNLSTTAAAGTAAAAAGTAAGMLGPLPATTMHSSAVEQGSEQQGSKGSPSEIHSDTQLHSKALYSSSSSTSSSTLQPQPLASSLSSTTLEPQDASILPQDASILPQEPAASILPGIATSSSEQMVLNPLTARNPLWQQDHQAGDHEQQQQQPQQQQYPLSGEQHCSIAPDGCSCQATTSSVAGWTDIIPLLPLPLAATANNSPQGLADSTQAACDLPADDSPLALPPGLAAKLRKLESGLSFRMLQPELSVSIRASDSLPDHSTAGVSDHSVTTAPVSDSVTTAAVSETHSGPASGPVSRRSTAGLSPRVLSLGGLNPAGPDDQLPASIPEHNSVTGPWGEAVPTAAAVAAAFEGDAVAVQGLVDAAAAAVPVPKPHHSRSKSAGVLSTPPAGHTAAAPTRAATLTAAGAASGGVAAVTAAGAPDAAFPMRPVPRTLSVSSSPFAQMDLQQAVTASLLRVTPMQPPRVAAAASPAALAGPSAAATPTSSTPGAARQSRRSLDAAMLATASTAAAAAAAALRPSSSSRSMSYGLTAQQLQQQNSQASHSLPGQHSLRPSMTSRLSWASTVTVIEPQSHIFTLLDSGSVTNSVSNDVTDEADDNAARILRPSKSMSSLPSFNGGTSSSAGSVSGMKKGKGIFGLPRVKSSAALIGVLKNTFSQPRASAAAAGKASPNPAAVPAAHLHRSSSSSSSGGSSQRLAPVASAPAAAPSPLRSILRRPSNVSSTSRQSSTWAADAARRTQTSLSALDQQTQQQQQQQVLLPASHSSRPSLASGAGSPFAALPPLPRPASSHSLDAAAAAAAAAGAASPGFVAPFIGGSSSSISMLPQHLASEGPFAAPHALPPELVPQAGSSQPGSGSAALSTARHSMQQQGSVASAPLQVLRQAYSTGASSIGQLSSSGSSSGAGGSLMSLAVTRMHSAAASCGNIAAATGPPALQQKSSSMPSMGSLNTARAQSSSSSTAVARAFAEAFLAALAAGNTKWASDAAVGQLLHETAKMVGLDKQLYANKTAIIRRLNGGMEQLVKMAQATAADSDGDDSAAAAADGIAALARKLPKPQLSVTCPDPKAKPAQVEAVYVFKWGIRKFTMKDEFIVRDGQILRLRRSRG